MRTSIPHSLGKAEATARLRSGTDRVDGRLPSAIGDVTTRWLAEDVMEIAVVAMGQEVRGTATVADTRIDVEFVLPPLLAMFEGAIERGVREGGTKLLEKK